tara:strand:- start:141 stop:1550 length:1410 start_codon:yes stop_codon:yes gene_type:complete
MELDIFIVTPRGGKQNFRVLTTHDPLLSTTDMTKLTNDISSGRMNDANVLFASQQVKQPSTGRMAMEVICFHCTAPENLNETIKREINLKLRSFLQIWEVDVNQFDWTSHDKNIQLPIDALDDLLHEIQRLIGFTEPTIQKGRRKSSRTSNYNPFLFVGFIVILLGIFAFFLPDSGNPKEPPPPDVSPVNGEDLNDNQKKALETLSSIVYGTKHPSSMKPDNDLANQLANKLAKDFYSKTDLDDKLPIESIEQTLVKVFVKIHSSHEEPSSGNTLPELMEDADLEQILKRLYNNGKFDRGGGFDLPAEEVHRETILYIINDSEIQPSQLNEWKGSWHKLQSALNQLDPLDFPKVTPHLVTLLSEIHDEAELGNDAEPEFERAFFLENDFTELHVYTKHFHAFFNSEGITEDDEMFSFETLRTHSAEYLSFSGNSDRLDTVRERLGNDALRDLLKSLAKPEEKSEPGPMN